MPIAGILIISPPANIGESAQCQSAARIHCHEICIKSRISILYRWNQLNWARKTPSMTGGSTAICVQGELDTPKAPRSGAYNNDSFAIKSTHYSKKKNFRIKVATSEKVETSIYVDPRPLFRVAGTPRSRSDTRKHSSMEDKGSHLKRPFEIPPI